jgi:cobaltochelatase CobT
MRGASGTAVGRDSSQPLVRASSAVCHALMWRRGVQATYGRLVPEIDWKALAAEVPNARTALASWRGRVDSIAARARYSNSHLHARHAPFGELARKLFDLLEQNRVEALAAREFPGMRSNLAALCQERWGRARPEGAIRGVGTGWLETLALLARLPLGAPFPEIAPRTFETLWRSWVAPDVAAALEEMRRLLDDQERFARRSLDVVAAVIPPRRASRAA